MKIEQISSVNFGIRPRLNVSKKYSRLFEDVADRFDVYNRRIKRNPDNNEYYEIIQDKNGLLFSANCSDGYEHSIEFGKKLTKEFLEKPVDFIAKTLADAAEIFALEDKLWDKTYKFSEKISKEKALKMSVEKQELFQDELFRKIYNKYFLTALKDRLKENGFIARAKIEL